MAERGLDRARLARDPAEVAPDLLNKLLVRGRLAGRIVEVEAYRGEDDPASHASCGPTPRAAIMFGPPGRLYVYLSYGVHHCANVVAHRPGEAGAVLVRALEPVSGTAEMAERRGRPRRPADLANGPGKLCQALGIGLGELGVDLLDPRSPVRLEDDGTPPPAAPTVGPRVGISKAVDLPLRFSVPDHPHRSRPW